MNRNLPDERMVFVDLETAGLDPWRPIIQIAAIAVDSNLKELERFEAKLKFSETDLPLSMQCADESKERLALDIETSCLLLNAGDRRPVSQQLFALTIQFVP